MDRDQTDGKLAKLQNFDTALGIITCVRDDIFLENLCCRANREGLLQNPPDNFWMSQAYLDRQMMTCCATGSSGLTTGGVGPNSFAFLDLEMPIFCFLGVSSLKEI